MESFSSSSTSSPPPLLLNIATTIIGFICFINGANMSREISAIASKRGLQPWLPAARKRREHFGFFFTITRFPSEILRIIHDQFLSKNKKNNIGELEQQKKKEINSNHQYSSSSTLSFSDEFLLEITAKLFSFVGFLIMVNSAVFQIYSSSSLSSSYLSSTLSFFAWFLFVLLSEPALLYFPWHCLLGETLFLLTIGELAPIIILSPSSSSSSSNNSYYSELLLRVLLARLMWGFSKTKFLASEWNDRYYLLPFLRSMPMPSPLGIKAAMFLEKHLFFDSSSSPSRQQEQRGTISKVEKIIKSNRQQHQPQHEETLTSKIIRSILVGSYIFFFFAEVISPFFILFPSRENWFWTKMILGPGSVFLLMSGIQISGNFGFFPLLTATLCLPAFGDETLPTLGVVNDIYQRFFVALFNSNSSTSSIAEIFLLFIFVLHTTYSIFSFPLISWFAPAWTNNFLGLLREKKTQFFSSSSSMTNNGSPERTRMIPLA